jgi:hypothetical protein
VKELDVAAVLLQCRNLIKISIFYGCKKNSCNALTILLIGESERRIQNEPQTSYIIVTDNEQYGYF